MDIVKILFLFENGSYSNFPRSMRRVVVRSIDGSAANELSAKLFTAVHSNTGKRYERDRRLRRGWPASERNVCVVRAFVCWMRLSRA